MDSDHSLEKCIDVIKNAKTDNEHMASLLLVTKMVKAEDCTDTIRTEVFDALGFGFVNRLLKTDKVPADCPSNMYKEVAVAVLASFCSLPHLASHPQMLANLPVFNQMISSTREDSTEDGSEASEVPSDRSIIDTVYECLTCIALQPGGCEGMAQHSTVTAYCKAISKQIYGKDRSLELLLHVINTLGPVAWHGNTDGLQLILNHLSKQFLEEQGSQKFEISHKLSCILSQTGKEHLEGLEDQTWTAAVRDGLASILQSRIASAQRDPALRLASVIIHHLGMDWALGTGENACKFILLLSHLACIEVRMTLEDNSLQQVIEHSGVLSSCYSLLENIIAYMTLGSSLHLDERQVTQLHSAMVGAFNAVTHFLLTVQEEYMDKRREPVVIAAVRVLGSWIAEETLALSQEINSLLPFLVLVSKDTYQMSKANVMNPVVPPTSQLRTVCITDSKIAHTQPTCDTDLPESNPSNIVSQNGDTSETSAVVKSVTFASDGSGSMLKTQKQPDATYSDVLKFLLPGLCHLTAEDKSREVLLEAGLLDLLGEYLLHLAEVVSGRGVDAGAAEVAMTTLCGVFMNLVLLEKSLMSVSPVAEDVLKFVIDTVPTYDPSDTEHIILLYNLTVLGFMLIRDLIHKLDELEGGCNLLVCGGVTLLSNVHIKIDQSGTDLPPKLSIADHLEPVWPHLAELWFLGMQTLAHLVQLYPPTAQAVLKSGWIPKLIKLQLDVKGHGVDMETAVSYRALLFEMARSSDRGRSVICKSGGLSMAKFYQFHDLVKTLES